MRSAVPSVDELDSAIRIQRRWGLRTIRTEEEQLRLAVEINQLLLDARRLARDEQVDDGLRRSQFRQLTTSRKTVTYIHVLLEAQLGVRSEPSDKVNNRNESKGSAMAYEGKMVPLAPPSGISLFFKDCVEARA